jgi:zinc transporter 9
MVRSIHDIKATDMGGQTVMFKAEADIDGREITRSYLEKIDIEKLLEVKSLKILYREISENLVAFV